LARLLLKLKSQKDYSYDKSYYHKLQGFIYKVLRETEYSQLHDKKGAKFFSFSNIFPIENNKAGTIKNLIIPSPNEKFIAALKNKFIETKEKRILANIGEMSLILREYQY